jgi:hypothetical protein
MKKNALILVPFLALLALLQFKTMAERPPVFDPDWHRLSKVLNDAVNHGLGRSALIVGNSYVYTSIDPARLHGGDVRYFNFARGGTASIETMGWLSRHGVFPRRLLVELNEAQAAASYPGRFDLIPTDPEGGRWQTFTTGVEIILRYAIESRFSFATYSLNVEDAANRWRAAVSPLTFIASLFTPDPAKVGVLGDVRYRYHGDGFVEDKRVYSTEEIARRTVKETSGSDGAMAAKAPFAASDARDLRRYARLFASHGTEVVFFRLPKHPDVIAAENLHVPEPFDAARELAARDPNVRFIDMSGPEDVTRFLPYLSDGGHWTAAGAALVSREFDARLGVSPFTFRSGSR